MSIRKIALFLVLVALFASCSKEGGLNKGAKDVTKDPNAVVYGEVAFYAEGETKLENAILNIYGVRSRYDYDYLASVQTDENGYYEFEYNANVYENYGIKLIDESLDRQYLSEECISYNKSNLACGNIILSNDAEVNFKLAKLLEVQLNISDSSNSKKLNFGSLKAYQYCQCERQDDKGVTISEGVVTEDFSMGIHIAPPIKFEWTIKDDVGNYTSYEKIVHQTTDECETLELNINY